MKFTKDTKAEVEELKKAPTDIFRRVAKETERRNAEWLYTEMKANMPERDYKGLNISDDWETLTKKAKVEEDESPPPPLDTSMPDW